MVQSDQGPSDVTASGQSERTMFKHEEKGAPIAVFSIMQGSYSREGKTMPPDACVFESEVLPSGEVTAKVTCHILGEICMIFGRLGESGKRFANVRNAKMELYSQVLNSGLMDYILAKGVSPSSALSTGSSANTLLDDTVDTTQSGPSEDLVSSAQSGVDAPAADPTPLARVKPSPEIQRRGAAFSGETLIKNLRSRQVSVPVPATRTSKEAGTDTAPRGAKRLRSADDEGTTSTHNSKEMCGTSYRKILDAYCSESGHPQPAIVHQRLMVEGGLAACPQYYTSALMGATPVHLPVTYESVGLAEEKICKLILKNLGITPKRR